ncbi:MAG: hypothetical protein KGH81_08275 [Thaumarchaeota archaeon]|nr:hypothetical protein [Nitrososphaerota archaeon]MDE1813017.1 hypothetical protein [Nitrososphaerota archaeon]
MKTVSTKINSKLYEDFVNTCNGSGCSVSEKLRELIQNHSENGSSGDIKQDSDSNMDTSKNYEGKIPVLHFHWEGNKLVQGETTWREREIPKARLVRIIR